MAKKVKITKKKIAVAVEKLEKLDYQDRVTFDFYNALKQVAGGKMIQRLSWNAPEVFGFLVNENLSLHKEDGNIHNWIVNLGDMVADDWVVLG
jgi:hypothetical protein